MSINFKCDACGLCCKNIGLVPLLPNFRLPNGSCKYLNTETNLCKIYSERPVICNVAASYEKYFSKIYTEDEFLKMNYDACENLKNNDLKQKLD